MLRKDSKKRTYQRSGYSPSRPFLRSEYSSR